MNVKEDLKNGDKVLFTSVNVPKEAEGTFIGYSRLGSAVIEHYVGGLGITAITYANQFRKKPEPKKRLMTAVELAGKWIRPKGRNKKGYFVVGFVEGVVQFPDGSETTPSQDWEYTTTPSDNTSWKSVLIEE